MRRQTEAIFKPSAMMAVSSGTRLALALVLGCSLCADPGCTRDTALAEHPVHDATVQAVTYYGVTLDRSATPQQVGYVLFRLIRDDFLAPSEVQRAAVLDKELAIAAIDVIRARAPKGLDQDQFLLDVVKHWTPTVSHYVNDFETQWPRAKARLVQTPVHKGESESIGKTSDPSAERCELLMEVNDPSNDPKAHVVIIVWLARDQGYWRVVHLGFENQTRSIEVIKAAIARKQSGKTSKGG